MNVEIVVVVMNSQMLPSATSSLPILSFIIIKNRFCTIVAAPNADATSSSSMMDETTTTLYISFTPRRNKT